MLIDRWGRPITYLRISVTDRCNLRCVYCMPADGVVRLEHEAIMRYEEIAEVVRVAAAEGIRRVRVTGGEPLVRHDLPALIRMIHATPGIEDISITTNGLLLERMASELKEAGLNRINVSLDTLEADKFARITRGGSLEVVMRGIAAAEAVGLAPIKINAVAMRGVNDDELVDLARLSVDHPWHVRFIELMPVLNQETWGAGFPPPAEAFLSIPEIKRLLEPLGLAPVAPPEQLSDPVMEGPAHEYQLPGAQGRIGFISPLSEHFCHECNRMRLTADGSFRPCLLKDEEIPFLTAMRAGEAVRPYLLKAVESKPEGHSLAELNLPTRRCMQQIGG
jgi:GTP 3',8-cyclase